MKALHVLAVASALVLTSTLANAQNAASNKAFFASSTNQLTVANVNGNNSPVTLFDIPAALKTSSTGGVSAILSMECALWTYNTVTATNGQGKSSSSSRAAITAWIEIDGVKAAPEKVVYCDRAQAVGLAVDLTCDAGTTSCTVSGTVTLDLFQATKNANSFTFFLGPLSPTTHSVKAFASGEIQCWSSTTGTFITCPAGSVANYTNAQTQALIGKKSLLIEEQQNFGTQ
jgi:hypothetical protein